MWRARIVALRRPVAVVVAVVVAATVGMGLWAFGRGDRSGADASAGTPSSTPSLSASATAEVSPSPSATPSPSRSTCATVARSFVPTSVVVPGVTSGARVVTPPRDSDNVPGVPPLTSRGKQEFAFDLAQGIRPGDPAGNTLLNAHTWPDGSAIGNRMLATLHTGDPIVVRGPGARLCYRVTQRIEVLAVNGYAHYYDRTGPPKLAIVVCSGKRLGPGVWTKRTIWFASPSV
jgi:hypothetical protein